MGSSSTGSWWGYAEADPTIVGVLVAVFGVLAVLYVVGRATGFIAGRDRRDRARRSSGGPETAPGSGDASDARDPGEPERGGRG